MAVFKRRPHVSRDAAICFSFPSLPPIATTLYMHTHINAHTNTHTHTQTEWEEKEASIRTVLMSDTSTDWRGVRKEGWKEKREKRNKKKKKRHDEMKMKIRSK